MKPILVALLLGCTSVSAQTCDYEAIVAQNFPSALKPGAAPSERAYDWACVDLDHGGKADSLVAAYSDSNAGIVRVLRSVGGTWTVIAEAETVFSLETEVFAQDLDGDQRPEVVVVATYRPDVKEYSIFRWDGQKAVAARDFAVQCDTTVP